MLCNVAVKTILLFKGTKEFFLEKPIIPTTGKFVVLFIPRLTIELAAVFLFMKFQVQIVFC